MHNPFKKLEDYGEEGHSKDIVGSCIAWTLEHLHFILC